jgi:hypothetical protein
MHNGVSVTLTMTAFDHGRTLEIHGTRASLRGGSPLIKAGTPELWLRDHDSGKCEPVEMLRTGAESATDLAGHGGGDWGMIDSLDRMFRGPNRLPAGLEGIAGHQLAFLAERSRLTRSVTLATEGPLGGADDPERTGTEQVTGNRLAPFAVR